MENSQDLLLVRLDSLNKLKQWDEMTKELADPQLRLTPPLVFRYRALAAIGRGDAIASQNEWERARDAAATGDSRALANLGNYLLDQGLDDEAKATFTRMTKIPDQSQAGYHALVQLEAKHGLNAELLATLNQMMADLPGEPEPKNDWAYLSLLLNTNVDQAYSIAQTLVAAHPEMLAYQSTLALGCLRRNDVHGAEQIYKGLNVDWTTSPDSWKMVHVMVLSAGGEKERARAFADTIDRSKLRTEELALLETYLPEEEKQPAREMLETNSPPSN